MTTTRPGVYTIKDLPSAYVVSTPVSVELLTNPLAVGVDFQRMMALAAASALAHLADAREITVDGPQNEVLCILRGGLSFDVGGALRDLTGVSPSVSFISSERRVSADGPSLTNSYQKLTGGATTFIGDIVATGTTVETAIALLDRARAERGAPASRLVVLSIATRPGLERIARVAEHRGPDSGILIVALEAAFELYHSDAKLPMHLHLTDMLPAGRPTSVEFSSRLLDNPGLLLERCVIYDGGQRAFEPAEHLRSLLVYWTGLLDAVRSSPELARRIIKAKLARSAADGDRVTNIVDAATQPWAEEVAAERLDDIKGALRPYTLIHEGR